ncbi:MAG: zinc ribbon domain-containing protein [Anaerolineae bacterium]
MSIVRQFYRLQLVDAELAERRAQLADIEASLGETDDVIRARQAVVEGEGNVARWRKELRALELEIDGLNDKLKRNQDRLYSGQIRNPKELSSLHNEANALRRRRSELEDRQLEAMIALEEEEAELAERQARLRQIEATWHQEQEALLTRKQGLELLLDELEKQRKELRTRLSAADRALYDELTRRLAGTAVALLKQGICQVCGVDVPVSMARAVERGEGIHRCPVCERLLYGG